MKGFKSSLQTHYVTPALNLVIIILEAAECARVGRTVKVYVWGLQHCNVVVCCERVNS